MIPAQRDPPERWELTSDEWSARSADIQEVFPYSPRRVEELPDGALGSLQETCALDGLRHLFMMPWSVRSTGCGKQKAISPRSVLGIGSRAVALWTQEPEPGVKVHIPLERLSAIEDVTILLYGRLSFLSFSETLTIRYNALGRSGLMRALRELRGRLGGPPRPLPKMEEGPPEMPPKWRRLLRSPLLRMHEAAPIAYKFAVAPGTGKDNGERGQLLVINAHELVYMSDPAESALTYGEDSYVVPRPRITRVRGHHTYLEVGSNGARLSLVMAPVLSETACHWLS